MPSDPTLWLYTSLTAGSSHIITATSRIETILKANKIPFKAVDCATDDKARMIWTRRAKGRKLPGLVKYNDVIADLEQVEEWNEYGELEEQIEEQIDVFGDVPVSATSAEAQASSAARMQAMEDAKRAAVSGGSRTASETRHISIEDPKERKAIAGSLAEGTKKDTPLSMAMRQAGVEAAAKAGEKKKTAAVGGGLSKIRDEESMPPPPAAMAAAKGLDAHAEEPGKVQTGAKTPEQLASEGQPRTSVDKLGTLPTEEEPSTKSITAQVIDQRRKASVPQTSSSLSTSTNIDESHTVTADGDKSTAKPTSIDEGDEDDADDEDEEDEEDEEEESDVQEPPTKAAKIGATDDEEEKVLKGSKPQEQDAKDADEASTSVAD